MFVQTSRAELGFSGEIGKLVCVYEELPQSSAKLTAYGPGHKHSLLPALAKNIPQVYFLNASRPVEGSLRLLCLWKTRESKIFDSVCYFGKLVFWETNFSLPPPGRWHFRKKMTEGVPLIKVN